MKNRNIILLITMIINISLFAQNKVDSISNYKNEIGINLLPFVSIASEGNNNRVFANVFYKRQLKQNWYGRASLILFSGNGKNNFNSTSIQGLPSSKLSIQYNENKYRPYLQANLGIERRFGRGKIKQFTGLDLGYAHYQTEHANIYGIRDSVEYNSPNSFIQPLKNDSIIFKKRITVNSIVFTPFYGLQFNISKHFLFSTQAGIALSFNKVNNTVLIDNQKIKEPSYSSANFDLDLSQVSCNFSICYRF